MTTTATLSTLLLLLLLLTCFPLPLLSVELLSFNHTLYDSYTLLSFSLPPTVLPSKHLPSYHRALGVATDGMEKWDEKRLKKRYREEAKKYHPDKLRPSSSPVPLPPSRSLSRLLLRARAVLDRAKAFLRVRRLLPRLPPPASEESADRFAALTSAMTTLKDPVLRREYDNVLRARLSSAPTGTVRGAVGHLEAKRLLGERGVLRSEVDGTEMRVSNCQVSFSFSSRFCCAA